MITDFHGCIDFNQIIHRKLILNVYTIVIRPNSTFFAIFGLLIYIGIKYLTFLMSQSFKNDLVCSRLNGNSLVYRRLVYGRGRPHTDRFKFQHRVNF